MALALGEDRDQHVGAGHLLAARRLHVDHGALDHALEAGGGLGVLAAVGDQVLKLGFEIGGEIALELFEVDVAGTHHRGRILVVDQREQQVLERGVFVVPFIGERQGPVERLLETAREMSASVALFHLYWAPSPGGFSWSQVVALTSFP